MSLVFAVDEVSGAGGESEREGRESAEARKG